MAIGDDASDDAEPDAGSPQPQEASPRIGAPSPDQSAQAGEQAFGAAQQQAAGAAQAFNTMRSTRAFISAIQKGGAAARNANKGSGFNQSR